MLPVTRLVLQLLRGNATAVKADKENGYVLQPLESAVKVHESILGGAYYKEVAPRVAVYSSMSSWYAKLCWRVSALERDDRVAKVLLRTTRHGRTKCKLQLTCKSHKSAGNVSHRNLHTSVMWAFDGLANWVDAKLV